MRKTGQVWGSWYDTFPWIRTLGLGNTLIYLHVCYLVLFPVETLHLVLFQLLSGLHILVIVTLKIKIDLHGHPTGTGT